MANPEHVVILKQGVEAWNEWREECPEVAPDLSRTDLSGIDLHAARLGYAVFSHCNLSKANLSNATLGNSTLCGADLTRANLNLSYLTGANLSNALISGASLMSTNLRHAFLCDAQLVGSDIRHANLERANLTGANLSAANLSGAYLSGAVLRDAVIRDTKLDGADLSGADLRRADLRRALLNRTNLRRANLTGANATGASTGGTVFAGIDLREVAGLESIIHSGPSEISISTLYSSVGDIPHAFLRGCGVPEDFMTYARSLTTRAIEFYSCFISYSSADQEFAERVHADLQAKSVRVWFAPHDMPIGARIRPTIDESIRVYDKLLLVLSEASVSSQWVEQEVETALAKERESESKTVLFPVRVDDAVMESRAGWPALLRNTRNVGDFTRWKEHDTYAKAFERLLRDLKADSEL